MPIENYTDEIIAADITKLKTLYRLKEVIRSDLTRATEDCTESVAEHIYGMHILALYFLPLEDPDGVWDRSLIFELITTHDLEEVITGDIVGWEKTAADRERERMATEEVIVGAPETLQSLLKDRLSQYNTQATKEAQFVKAIDKIEPHVHFFDESKKWIFKRNKITADKAQSIKLPYIADFPFIKKCNAYLHQQMLQAGYYYTE